MRRELTLGLALSLIGGWAAAGEPISLAEALRRAREDSREVAAANARREAA